MEDSKSDEDTQHFTPEERKQHVEKEQQAVEKEVEELLAWTDMIEGMSEAQLKNYVKNRPEHLKTERRENCEEQHLKTERRENWEEQKV